MISNLDIFDEVGRGVAHDEIVHFTVKKGGTVLQWDEEESNLDGNGRSVRVDFVKGPYDNPKINAIVLLKGDPDGELECLARGFCFIQSLTLNLFIMKGKSLFFCCNELENAQ